MPAENCTGPVQWTAFTFLLIFSLNLHKSLLYIHSISIKGKQESV